MKVVIVAAVAAACLAMPAYAATDAECTDMWKRADVNADGVLSDAEAQRYAAAMRVNQKTVPADGRINQATFMEGCRSDAFAPRKADAGAPRRFARRLDGVLDRLRLGLGHEGRAVGQRRRDRRRNRLAQRVIHGSEIEHLVSHWGSRQWRDAPHEAPTAPGRMRACAPAAAATA